MQKTRYNNNASGRYVRTGYNGSGYMNYYNRTSEAIDYSGIDYYEASREKKRIKKQRRVKSGLRYEYAGKSKTGVSLCAAISIALIFVSALGVSLSYAVVLNKQIEVAALNQELKQAREANAVTETEIAKSYDLKEIEQIATTKLGMAKPKAHQIVHINVPPQSYAVQTDIGAPDETQETLGGKIMKLIRG